MAEGQGFEPWVSFPTIVFETIRFGRSRTPPRLTMLANHLCDSLVNYLFASKKSVISFEQTSERTPPVTGAL